VLDDATLDRIQRQVLVPTVDALRAGIDYRGVLFAGMMLTPGGPKVLEFNVVRRPGARRLMARLKSVCSNW
jgi:phosphoribosylamine--glycine ligase